MASLLRLYREGLMQPLHFFPKSAWAYRRSGDLRQARTKFTFTPRTPHAEGADASYRLALRGGAEPIDAAFVAHADAVFAPLQACLLDARP